MVVDRRVDFLAVEEGLGLLTRLTAEWPMGVGQVEERDGVEEEGVFRKEGFRFVVDILFSSRAVLDIAQQSERGSFAITRDNGTVKR
jgi:hypothetical protein